VTRVALLSHRGGNIGHEFMAAGFESIVRQAFGGAVEISHYEQHRPFSIYPEGHVLRGVDRIPYGRLRWLKRLLGSRTACRMFWGQASRIDVRVAIACGGPNIVSGVSRSVEMRLMFHHLNGVFHRQGIPVIDAAVGACFPIERVPERIEDEDDVAFYLRLFELCARSTVRDRLAQKLWRQMGREAALIPCAAMVSGRELQRLGGAPRSEYVLINFQERGANEDWGQNVDTSKWLSTVVALVDRLRKRHAVLFVCHDDRELALVDRHFPGLVARVPRTLGEYAKVAMGAKAVLASRVHATIPMAGAGIPGVHIGTDTRLGTVEEIGLPAVYVKNATTDLLEAKLEELIRRRDDEIYRLLAVREQAALSYVQIIQETAERRT